MFGKQKKCRPPPSRLSVELHSTTDADEVAKLSKLRCPSGTPLHHIRSQAPSVDRLKQHVLTDDVWLCDHVLACSECGAEIAVTSTRPGDLPSPNNSAFKSKPRADVYIVQHKLLPISLFRYPDRTLGELIEEPTIFGQSLLKEARIAIGANSGANDPILHSDHLSLFPNVETVLVAFSLPRAMGEAYFALAGYDRRTSKAYYFVSERTVPSESPHSRHRAVLGRWTTKGGESTPSIRFNMGNLPSVDDEAFVAIVKEILERELG